MVQRCEDLGLALESAYAIGISRKLVRQDLDGNFTFQLQVARAVHLTLCHPYLEEP
jgi:hypothetical protein